MSKPTLSNVTIIADKRVDDDPYILNFKKGSGGFFHNTVVSVAPENATPINQCINVNGADSEGLIGTALVLNNWIQDCAAAAGDRGTLANVDMSAGALNINAVAAQLDNNVASQAPEAILDTAMDWAAVNASLPESTADAEFLDSVRFMGRLIQRQPRCPGGLAGRLTGLWVTPQPLRRHALQQPRNRLMVSASYRQPSSQISR